MSVSDSVSSPSVSRSPFREVSSKLLVSRASNSFYSSLSLNSEPPPRRFGGRRLVGLAELAVVLLGDRLCLVPEDGEPSELRIRGVELRSGLESFEASGVLEGGLPRWGKSRVQKLVLDHF
jgi:hypothetical protein